jgi:hypothetical protein
MTPSGIEPAACRLVARCLNQLRTVHLCLPKHLYDQSPPFLAPLLCLSGFFSNLIMKISTLLAHSILSYYRFQNGPNLYPRPLCLTQLLSSRIGPPVTSKLKVSVRMNSTDGAQLTPITNTATSLTLLSTVHCRKTVTLLSSQLLINYRWLKLIYLCNNVIGLSIHVSSVPEI